MTPGSVVLTETPHSFLLSPSAALPQWSPPPHHPLASTAQTRSWWAWASWTVNVWHEQFAVHSCHHAGAALCLQAAPSLRRGSRCCKAPAEAWGSPLTWRRWWWQQWDRAQEAAMPSDWGNRLGRKAGSRAVWAFCLGRKWPDGGGPCDLRLKALKLQAHWPFFHRLWTHLLSLVVLSPVAKSTVCTWRREERSYK